MDARWRTEHFVCHCARACCSAVCWQRQSETSRRAVGESRTAVRRKCSAATVSPKRSSYVTPPLCVFKMATNKRAEFVTDSSTVRLEDGRRMDEFVDGVRKLLDEQKKAERNKDSALLETYYSPTAAPLLTRLTSVPCSGQYCR